MKSKTTQARAHLGNKNRNTARLRLAALLAIPLWIPLAVSQIECEAFKKQVCVQDCDNEANWKDADDPSTAPTKVAGVRVEYRFIVTNCAGDKNCYNTRIVDPILGIDNLTPALPPEGSGDPFDGTEGFLGGRVIYISPFNDPVTVTITSQTPGFGNLSQEECIPKNVATEVTYLSPEPGLDPETFSDPAYVDCGPKITIEKFTNGHDADNANGSPILTPPAGPFVVGADLVPLVAIGDAITWTYRVTNTGQEALLVDRVADRVNGVNTRLTCPAAPVAPDTLAPGGSFDCTVTGTALDLTLAAGTVDGCGAGTGNTQPTYENRGGVVAFGAISGIQVNDTDFSHYCNPPKVMIEKFTNGHDGDNPNGIPAADSGNSEPGSLQVAEVPGGEPITWTYEVTNNGDEVLDQVMVTDSRGVDVNCPQDTLEPGETIICSATGFADALLPGDPNVDGCGAGTGNTRPTYENLGSVEAVGRTSNLLVTDDDPSHYCNPDEPPECGLTVDKFCEIAPPPLPPANDEKCDGKLQQFTMIWNGVSSTQVSGVPNNAPGGVVLPSQEVTFFGPFDDNNVMVNVGSGRSTFHVSCSDPDMDGATETNENQEQVSPVFARDCGKDQGDGKKQDFPDDINTWLLEGFVDNSDAVLDCTSDSDPGTGQTSCDIIPVEASCDTLGKPSNLTFVYTGGSCPGTNSQGGKSDCSGPNNSEPVSVILDGSTQGPVALGESFIVPATGSNTTIVLSNGGGTQTNDVHTSCSAPLVAGESFGGMTLVALDGVGNGSEVTYSYLVSNTGGTSISGINVTDDQLGTIGSIVSLAGNTSQALTKTVFISETTINTATATADGFDSSSAACTAMSNPVVVTVNPPPPPPVSCRDIKDITELTMVWNGPSGVDIMTSPGQSFTDVQNGNQITFSTVGVGNDVELFLSGSVGGTSEFHVSCSDDGMNGSEDCGTAQGNGKDDDSSLNNQFLLDGMTGEDGSFACGLNNTGVVDPSAGGPTNVVTAAPSLEVDDDKVKWELTNHGNETLYVTEVIVTWPSQHDELKTIKLDGDFGKDLHDPNSSTSLPGEYDFTGDLDKRKFKAGDTKNLEIQFEEKYKLNSQGDYTISISFDNGQTLTFP